MSWTYIRSLLSLMLARPRDFKLFPYTTLFRSTGARERLDRQPQPPLAAAAPASAPASELRPRAAADRKSTRLNSSHSQISYAVFCLKKKKPAYRLPQSLTIVATILLAYPMPPT